MCVHVDLWEMVWEVVSASSAWAGYCEGGNTAANHIHALTCFPVTQCYALITAKGSQMLKHACIISKHGMY